MKDGILLELFPKKNLAKGFSLQKTFGKYRTFQKFKMKNI
jgi:hypothetical protein